MTRLAANERLVSVLVLVIACGNVATVLLTTGIARQPDVAVRLALGASRSRIARQFIIESVLVGLAAKNAILIVEFAKQAEESGADPAASAVTAAQTRLRPILTTSLSFIFGVVPLVIATGAGAEMRRSLGTAVFSGMIGVTLFGLVFTPVFYVVLRRLTARRRRGSVSTVAGAPAGE